MPREHLQWKTLEARGLTEIQLAVELLTPLFGGGVGGDPRKSTPHVKPHDPVTLFRGASMRGQLRFWWRVTQHLKEGTINQEQASTIWGAASKPAKVSLSVVNPSPPKESQSSQGFQATLTLRFPNDDRVRSGVRDALCAWLILGGLGGRTRRGSGAIHSQWLVNEGIDVPTWLSDHHVPFRESSDFKTPLLALEFGLGKLKKFRPEAQMGRRAGGPRPSDTQRMASPLILRPYRTNKQMFRCLAVLLPPAYRLAAASELTLHDPKDKKRSFPVSHHLTPLEAGRIQPLTNQPDPLCAFLDFFQPQTHQESR